MTGLLLELKTVRVISSHNCASYHIALTWRHGIELPMSVSLYFFFLPQPIVQPLLVASFCSPAHASLFRFIILNTHPRSSYCHSHIKIMSNQSCNISRILLSSNFGDQGFESFMFSSSMSIPSHHLFANSLQGIMSNFKLNWMKIPSKHTWYICNIYFWANKATLWPLCSLDCR